MKALATITLALALTGCSSLSPVSIAGDVAKAAVGAEPGITAQVGKTNTKQGIGVTASQEESSSISPNVEVKQADTVNTVTKASKTTTQQRQTFTTGNVQAETVNLTGNDTESLAIAFLAGLIPPLLILLWVLPTPAWARHNGRENQQPVSGTGETGEPGMQSGATINQ